METDRSSSCSIILRTKSERTLGRHWDCPSAEDLIPVLRSRTVDNGFQECHAPEPRAMRMNQSDAVPTLRSAGVTDRYRRHRWGVRIKKHRSPVVRQHRTHISSNIQKKISKTSIMTAVPCALHVSIFLIELYHTQS